MVEHHSCGLNTLSWDEPSHNASLSQSFLPLTTKTARGQGTTSSDFRARRWGKTNAFTVTNTQNTAGPWPVDKEIVCLDNLSFPQQRFILNRCQKRSVSPRSRALCLKEDGWKWNLASMRTTYSSREASAATFIPSK